MTFYHLERVTYFISFIIQCLKGTDLGLLDASFGMNVFFTITNFLFSSDFNLSKKYWNNGKTFKNDIIWWGRREEQHLRQPHIEQPRYHIADYPVRSQDQSKVQLAVELIFSNLLAAIREGLKNREWKKDHTGQGQMETWSNK